MIKAIFFDLDDTLYPYEEINKRACNLLAEAVSEKYGISRKEAETAYEYGRQATKSRLPNCAAKHNRMLYCQNMLEYLNRNPVKDALSFYDCYWDDMLKNMSLYDGVIDLLDFLRERDIKIGICTDLTAHIQHRKIKRLGIADYIDYLVTSEEAGAEKPDAAIFALCCHKSWLEPTEILLVGDSPQKDICGAKNFGMKTVLSSENGWMEKVREAVDDG